MPVSTAVACAKVLDCLTIGGALPPPLCTRACVRICVRACVRACVRICVRACMRARVHACVACAPPRWTERDGRRGSACWARASVYVPASARPRTRARARATHACRYTGRPHPDAAIQRALAPLAGPSATESWAVLRDGMADVRGRSVNPHALLLDAMARPRTPARPPAHLHHSPTHPATPPRRRRGRSPTAGRHLACRRPSSPSRTRRRRSATCWCVPACPCACACAHMSAHIDSKHFCATTGG